METSVFKRHQIINNFVAQSTTKPVIAIINLWRKMAIQIISIIGVGGFNSIYSRSLFITQSKFPWIKGGPVSNETEDLFTELKISLEGQASEIACEASCFLIITFTDTLATLIGEHLMANIFRSVWSDEASDNLDIEIINE